MNLKDGALIVLAITTDPQLSEIQTVAVFELAYGKRKATHSFEKGILWEEVCEKIVKRIRTGDAKGVKWAYWWIETPRTSQDPTQAKPCVISDQEGLDVMWERAWVERALGIKGSRVCIRSIQTNEFKED